MGERPAQKRENVSYDNPYEDIPINNPKRGGANGGMPVAAYANNGSSGSGGLYPCSVCNRTFTSDRIEQHEAACAKSNKQRRVFDSTKQRIQGTEAASFFRKGKGGKGRNEPAKPQVKAILNDKFHRNNFALCTSSGSKIQLETKT